VIEMDAASHRGVADIEEVRKAVGFGPMHLRYKVFIIDEAHQLSSDAKDAFLKTLEEPPGNVVFILATTEPQAIPITIRSRCQQFDFKRGSLGDIARRLRYVLDQEGVTHTPEAVNLVARGAEGSYRDALSLLEQVLAFSPKSLTPADVDAVLGTLDAELLAQLTDVIARRDAPAAFALAGDMLDAGKEARTLLRTLAAHFRDLLLVSVGGPAVAQELTPEEVGRLQIEARRFAHSQMLRALDILNEAQAETRHNNQHRLLIELTFLKLMNLGDAPNNAAAVAAGATAFATPANFATAPIVFSSPGALTPIPSPSWERVPDTDSSLLRTKSRAVRRHPSPSGCRRRGMGVRAATKPKTRIRLTPTFFRRRRIARGR
jgi:DNA polymerase-3 subunit gamma/tau